MDNATLIHPTFSEQSLQKDIDKKPWYRQFWPWLIVGLPACCVVAAVFTVLIANRDADDMVVDNYYKDGKIINQRLEQDNRAAELQLVAELSFNFDSGQLNLSLTGQQLPDTLQLQLLHPFEADRDKTIPLQSLGNGNYRGQLNERLQYRYLLRLLPGVIAENQSDQAALAPWRLNGEIDFQRGNGAILSFQQ